MEINTFFWEDNIISKSKMFVRKVMGKNRNSFFTYGNAGDVFAKNLMSFAYNSAAKNSDGDGNRLLCIGSIAHRARQSDILCGVGVKNNSLLPPKDSNLLIYGLRGPLSYEALKGAGFPVDTVKFLLDPGLLIKFMIDNSEAHEPKNISFIPHYRERFNYQGKLPKDMTLIDIDNDPIILAKEILSSKIVYSSSLHGIIFSHALGVPCIYVKPQSDESEFKFIDYFESVDLTYKKPLGSIFEANYTSDSDSPADVKFKKEDFYFPTMEELKERDILV